MFIIVATADHLQHIYVGLWNPPLQTSAPAQAATQAPSGYPGAGSYASTCHQKPLLLLPRCTAVAPVTVRYWHTHSDAEDCPTGQSDLRPSKLLTRNHHLMRLAMPSNATDLQTALTTAHRRWRIPGKPPDSDIILTLIRQPGRPDAARWRHARIR